MPNNDLTPESFKQRIVAKYPKGVSNDGTPYASMDATELTKRISTRYPDGVTSDGHKYSDFLPKQQATSPTSPSQPQDMQSGAASALGSAANFLFPVAGDIKNLVQGKNTKSFGQIAGDTALSALPLIPGLGEVGEGVRAAGLVGKIAANPIARNAVIGYGSGVASNLSQGDSLGQSLMPNVNTVGGAIVGGGTAGLLKGLAGGAAGLRKSATEDINAVLSPTTKDNKIATQKIAPELAKSGPTAMSREGLLSKYQAKAEDVSGQLEAKYESLPPDAKVEVGGLFDGIQKKIDALTLNGVVPSAAKTKVEAYQNVMKDLANAGLEVSPDGTQVFADVANVRKLRQIMDSGTRNFSFSDFDSANSAAKKELGNSIREAFSQQHPDIAKLNKDFHFWQSASDVLEAAIQRKTGQSGVIRKGIAAGLGAGIGLPTGHPGVMALTGKVLGDFINSPAYHTTSAKIKSKVADLLEKGDAQGAGKLLQSLMVRAPSITSVGAQGLINSNGL